MQQLSFLYLRLELLYQGRKDDNFSLRRSIIKLRYDLNRLQVILFLFYHGLTPKEESRFHEEFRKILKL